MRKSMALANKWRGGHQAAAMAWRNGGE